MTGQEEKNPASGSMADRVSSQGGIRRTDRARWSWGSPAAMSTRLLQTNGQLCQSFSHGKEVIGMLA